MYKRVIWEIDIFDSPTDRDAITEAISMMPRMEDLDEFKGSYAGIFTVNHLDDNTGKTLAIRQYDIDDENEVEVGDSVLVVPNKKSNNKNAFIGTVLGFHDRFIVVADQDNLIEDYEPWQVAKRKE